MKTFLESKLVASANGYDDFDVDAMQIHRVCVPHGVKRGDTVNVYCANGRKLGATWKNDLGSTLAELFAGASYKLLMSESTHGSVGKHDWAVKDCGEEGSAVYVDDRQLGYHKSLELTQGYAWVLICRLHADGDYRLSDKPHGFLPPATDPNPGAVKKVEFTPTADMVQAASTLVQAMAIEQTTRPIVEEYQKAILQEREWLARPELSQRRAIGPSERIVDPKLSYLMSESDFGQYDALCKAARVKSGLSVEKPDHCPLLEAETWVRQAQFHLIESLSGITGITGARAVTLLTEKYAELVDISLRLLAPFVEKSLR